MGLAQIIENLFSTIQLLLFLAFLVWKLEALSPNEQFCVNMPFKTTQKWRQPTPKMKRTQKIKIITKMSAIPKMMTNQTSMTKVVVEAQCGICPALCVLRQYTVVSSGVAVTVRGHQEVIFRGDGRGAKKLEGGPIFMVVFIFKVIFIFEAVFY